MAEMAEEMLIIESQEPPAHQGKFLIVSSSANLPDLPLTESLPALKLAEAVCQYQRRRTEL